MTDARTIIVRGLCKEPCRYPSCTCEPAEARAEFERDADAIITALSAQGLVIVPREPSEAMQDALIEAVKDGITINDDAHRTARHAYRAIVATATPSTDPGASK